MTFPAPPSGWDSGRDPRFEVALSAIDAVNAEDPTTVDLGDGPVPKELAHAEQMTAWVLRLDPDADDAQLLAARAHHLRRWATPRSEYPEGRAGYLRWRKDLQQSQAAEARSILTVAGYGDDTIDVVDRIMRKQGLGADATVQTHEDALCLVFISLQFDELAGRLDRERMVAVVRKTLAKMSDVGRAHARQLSLSDDAREIIREATA